MFKAIPVVESEKSFQKGKQLLDVYVKDEENPCENDSWSSTMRSKTGRPCAFDAVKGGGSRCFS